MVSSDDPPNSRIFILHHKHLKPETIKVTFSKFGNIKNVSPVTDRETGQPKGITYVKYSKMSEAAAAVEDMNGFSIDNSSPPIKVAIASSREEGSRKYEDETERFSRLFIMIPKDNSISEADLYDDFRQFGAVESVMIMTDKDTNENKGFAYIKFYKIYDAAKALEECHPKYKAVLARPRIKREERSFSRSARRDYSPPPPLFSHAREEPDRRGSRYIQREKEGIRLSAFVTVELSDEHIYRLFDLMPGLLRTKIGHQISHRTRQVFLEYDTIQSAEYSLLKLNGFEYPIGEPILVKRVIDEDDKRMY